MMASKLDFLGRMANYFLPLEFCSSTLFAGLAIACSIFTTWRIRRFSLALVCSPHEPQQLTYWILCVSTWYSRRPKTSQRTDFGCDGGKLRFCNGEGRCPGKNENFSVEKQGNFPFVSHRIVLTSANQARLEIKAVFMCRAFVKNQVYLRQAIQQLRQNQKS